MRSKNKEVLTLQGQNISHIHGLINSLTYYLKHGVTPIFIFDGKSPDIKKNKIEERRHVLKQNLKKLKELEIIKNDINSNIKKHNNKDISDDIDLFNLTEQNEKMTIVQEEYKKIYKKSIILKDYFVIDWIQILELLGLPVLKANEEADPLCAFMSNIHNNIYGVISDDSDMLVFGAKRLMRKSVNQQFTIIELSKLINEINILLLADTTYLENNNKKILFNHDNLIDFSLLLGTDYGSFKLKKEFTDTFDLLKYYMLNGIDSLINTEDKEKFNEIKQYYKNVDFDKKQHCFIEKNVWKKPKLLELKKRLLELKVDEDYIDKINEIIYFYYSKYLKRIEDINHLDFRNPQNPQNIRNNIFDNNFVSNNNYKNSQFVPYKKYNSFDSFRPHTYPSNPYMTNTWAMSVGIRKNFKQSNEHDNNSNSNSSE
jgi:5'-3' exonuclease